MDFLKALLDPKQLEKAAGLVADLERRVRHIEQHVCDCPEQERKGS